MNNRNFLIVLFLALVFVACEKDDEYIQDIEETMVSIAKADSESGYFSVELLAKDTLFEGYNSLFLDITKKSDLEPVSQASVAFFPLMNMVAMKHAAPVENPETFPNEEGYFEGAVVFIMPDNPDESWSLAVAIDADGVKDTVNLMIPVVKSLEEARKISIISEIDGKIYFISLLEPSEPKVGMNDIEFTVHYRQNMMSFPPDEDISITIEPEMPSMGHGSPNNENPVHVGNGHYKGKVNFTMTGWWRINLELTKNGATVANDLSFDVTF